MPTLVTPSPKTLSSQKHSSSPRNPKSKVLLLPLIDEVKAILQERKVTLSYESLSVDIYVERLAHRMAHNISSHGMPENFARIIASSWIQLISHGAVVPREHDPVVETLENGEALFVLTKDSPFIVSSLTEATKRFGLTISHLLHPIFSIHQVQISLSLILFGEGGSCNIPGFRDEVSKTLIEVATVTSSFSATINSIRNFQSILTNSPLATHKDASELLNWLIDGSFIFYGLIERQSIVNANDTLKKTLGLASDRSEVSTLILSETLSDASLLNGGHFNFSEVPSQLNLDSPVVKFSRLSVTSRVVRRLPLSSFTFTCNDTTLSVIGIFSTRGSEDDARRIPILRSVFRDILVLSEAQEHSYDFGYIVETFNRMPKEIVFSLDASAIYECIALGMSVHDSSDVQVLSAIDESFRGVTLLTVIGRERFSRELKDRIQQYFEQLFDVPPGSAGYYLDFSSHPQSRLYFYLSFQDPLHARELISSLNFEQVCETLSDTSRLWKERFLELLLAQGHLVHQSEQEAENQNLAEYSDAFSVDYQATYPVETALSDVLLIESIVTPRTVAASITPITSLLETTDLHPTYSLTLVRLHTPLTVSGLLPILEHFGLEVRTGDPYRIQRSDDSEAYLQRLVVAINATHPSLKDVVDGNDAENLRAIERRLLSQDFAQCITDVVEGRNENDSLNELILTGSLPTFAIKVLRAYCGLLWQVQKTSSRQSIFSSLSSVPSAAVSLFRIFDTLFNPNIFTDRSLTERLKYASPEQDRFRDALQSIKDITIDRVLRSLFELMSSTLRTSAYINDEAIAIKLFSEKAEVLPLPRPKFEIYIHSPQFEGSHLRSAEVARGGIRWSERPEDFRSEILGLMKTQRVKNVLICPGGAKGGFVIKRLPKSPSEIRGAVEQFYKEFIRSLLSITDNRVGDSIVTPHGVLAYDGHDPYLVVAADKGTASFSDIANNIAVDEFSFWLGDAFASGGSNGYDHKKYGITARGAWEGVRRHFNDLNIDLSTSVISVIGIGDMSGDVFGNGLIYSPNIKLIAAFNHKHIFLDPLPDPQVSYCERLRLFSLPSSQWSDYDVTLVSKGGGIYGRYDKNVPVSDEVRSVLGFGDSLPSTMYGEDLIHHILRAPCDLLWNGGIGTYVKATKETHSEVNDGTNDRVRVDASMLRAKVAGEGGNLGFTQSARTEFAKRGGRINTDAIDNSGGVDLSDHEVNLKILFKPLVEAGTISLARRNEILKEVAHEVVEAVLHNNRINAQILSVAVNRSKKTIGFFQSLLRRMEKMKLIARSLDSLPHDAEIEERMTQGLGFERPELAVLIAAVKMWIKSSLLESKVIDDPYCERYLFSYFPTKIQEDFPESIRNHPLRPVIIATQLTNHCIEMLGVTFAHRMSLAYSTSASEVVKASIVASALFDIDELRANLQQLDVPQRSNDFIDIINEINHATRTATTWLLESHSSADSVSMLVSRYNPSCQRSTEGQISLLSESEVVVRELIASRAIGKGLSPKDALHLAHLSTAPNILELSFVAKIASASLEDVARVHRLLIPALSLEKILQSIAQLQPHTKWDQQLIAVSSFKLRQALGQLVRTLVKHPVVSVDDVFTILSRGTSYELLLSTIVESATDTVSAAMFAIISELLTQISVQVNEGYLADGH
jgi:glutamate dehydrogenase